MNDKKLVDTAVLAGTIMLVSGAEIYRVEDTILHMLSMGGRRTCDTIVYPTGIYVTMADPEIDTITLCKRISNRSNNLNKIYKVNDISRKFCEKQMNLDEAYQELLRVEQENLYRTWQRILGFIGVCAFFTTLFGGNMTDWTAAAIVGTFSALMLHLARKMKLNDFCVNGISAFVLMISASVIKVFFLPAMTESIVVTSAIMPLVPGVVFTTAIRDTLNGDYSSGMARIMEALVIALGIAAGAGAGMAVFEYFMGGIAR